MSGEKGFIPPQLPPLEAAPIGWQLFVLESGKSDSMVFLLLLATYATRLLAQALRRGGMNQTRRTAPNRPTRSTALTSLLGPFRVNGRRLRETPQAYRGGLDPDEQRDDEQIVGHARK